MLPSDKTYLKEYGKNLKIDLDSYFDSEQLVNKGLDLGYAIQASAVFSSNIEGNSIDLNSYMNSVINKGKFKQQKEVDEINDLVEAYNFAKENELNESNFLVAHKILSKNLLLESKKGVYRNEKMGVFDVDGLVYLAVEPEFVADKMKEFFDTIGELLSQELSISESFYHAALIHLIFVHIHPFSDGNGRAARLLEKWFLSQSISQKIWAIQSEKYYKEHQSEYYKNINLGVNYYELDYSKCMPFLLMLTDSVGE